MTTSERPDSLRGALAAAEERGELVHIGAPVEPGYELPNIVRANFKLPRRPALLFENVQGFPGWRVATSMIATPERAAAVLGLPAGRMELRERVLEAIDRPVPPVIVDRAPCQEQVITQGFDLRRLIPATHGAMDVTHWYWQGPVITRDLVTGKQNLGLYRSCVQGPDTITVNGRWDRHMGFQLSDAKRMGKSLPVAVVLGPDPLLFPLAATKLVYGADDFGFAGALRGRPVELVRCKTNDLLVPATAEIVIEGEIRPPYEMGDDGPWPEFLDYLGMNIHPPLVHVTAVTHRQSPISYVTLPSSSGDSNGMLQGPALMHALRGFAGGFVVDCAMAPGAKMQHTIIKVRKTEPAHEGLQINVAMAAFGHLTEIDRVTLVDEDIDIRDPAQVNWAEVTRCDPGSQVHILPPARSHQNNPIAGVKEFLGGAAVRSKMIVDATIPWQYRTAEKSPGLTYFTRSRWDDVDLAEYFSTEDAARWIRRGDR